MDFSVVICTYNRSDTLRVLLVAIENQLIDDRLEWEIIVVDNNSSDNTKSVVEELSRNNPDRLIYQHESKQGKSFALNRGVDNAKGDIIIFCDDDIEPVNNWLQSYIDCFKDNKCVGVGGRILPRFEIEPEWLSPDMSFPYRFNFGDSTKPLTSPLFGANMAYLRTVFENYDQFREDLGPTSENPNGLGEDSEFSSRLIANNEILFYSHKALVYHPVTKSQSEKKFLYDWSFRYGQSIILRNALPKTKKQIFGVPMYILKEYLLSCIFSIVHIQEKERFRYRLIYHKIKGQIKGLRVNAARINSK